MRRIATFFCLLVSFSFLLPASIFATNPPDGINLIKDGNGYLIEFSIPQYTMPVIYAEGEEYLNLTIPGYGVTPDAGLPALPLISFNLFIPVTEEAPALEILNTSKTEINLAEKIFPKQAPWSKLFSKQDRPFTINRQYYKSNGQEYPDIVISDPFIIAGIKGVIVTVYPFNYNPAENLLAVLQSGSFRISFEQPLYPVSNVPEAFDNFYKEIFVNYKSSSPNSSMRYLIITAPAFEAGLSSFVNHKTGVGFDVDLFNTTVTGGTNSSIKNFIQQRYNDPSTKPEFVLLVGDVNQIPAWNGSGEGTPTTDLNYAQLEGSDYFADVFIGRFSVSSLTELQHAIDKSVFMENYIGTLDKKTVFMASTDNWQISEGTHNYVIDNYFHPANYITLKLYTHTYNATTQQLIEALNDNQQFAVYSGHGYEYGWADGPPLSQTDVGSLVNTWYPFVYSFSCLTGAFQNGECFGETWLRAEHGASAFYGSSVTSYWDEDDILERKIFQAMFDDDKTRITPMFDQGKIYLVDYYGGINGTTLRYIEMYNLMGDPSLPVAQQIPPDNTPPDPIVDLSYANPTSNSITINWTAPYDSTFGGVTSYDIRYSTSMINNDNDFNNAAQILLTGVSDTAGTPRSYTVDSLDFITTYYFAVKAMDIWGNKSDMSNVVSETTLYAPQFAASTDSLHCVVLVNTVYTDSIIISNVSNENSTLDYSVYLTNNVVPDNVAINLVNLNSSLDKEIAISKNNPVNTHGFSIKGGGGPDDYGYKWIDSNEPNGPQYLWEDISQNPDVVEITNWIGNLDDGYTSAIPIGFDFEFYGDSYSNVYVSTNGFITFSTLTSAYYTNDPIPESGVPNNLICPVWDDLDGRAQGSVYYLQEADRFILQFTNWQHYSETGSYTFQAVLKSNNRIYFYYNNLSGILNSATVGIENGSGTDGLQMVYNANYLENELAVQISADPEWLSLDHLSGTLYNGTSAAIILSIDANDLELGDYSMDMVFNTNDPDHPEVTIPVTMTVTDIVPVELESFTANVKGNKVQLTWQTATEINNTGFAIERQNTSNVKGEPGWNKIAFVEGMGTTTKTTGYTFEDNIKKPAVYKYRLKQIDYDGTFEYSEEIQVDVAGPKNFSLYQNYPNPFNPSTKIKFSLPNSTNVKLTIYNTVGEVVAVMLNQNMEAGFYEVEFNANNYASGVYYYRLETNEFTAIKKMLLIK